MLSSNAWPVAGKRRYRPSGFDFSDYATNHPSGVWLGFSRTGSQRLPNECAEGFDGEIGWRLPSEDHPCHFVSGSVAQWFEGPAIQDRSIGAHSQLQRPKDAMRERSD
jgi:hypothetical protein